MMSEMKQRKVEMQQKLEEERAQVLSLPLSLPPVWPDTNGAQDKRLMVHW